jgi:hypothetical protein
MISIRKMRRKTSTFDSFVPSFVLSPSSFLSFAYYVSCTQLDRVFAALRRLHDSGRARFFLDGHDLLVVGDHPSQVEVVATSFATSQSRDEYEERIREADARRIAEGGCRAERYVWCEPEEHLTELGLERYVPMPHNVCISRGAVRRAAGGVEERHSNSAFSLLLSLRLAPFEKAATQR